MTADLIARMESADAGSRDLDAEVAMALGWTRGEFGNWWTTYPNGQSVNRKTEPPLTTDLTTIVAEIERRLPGWGQGSEITDGDACAWLYPPKGQHGVVMTNAKTETLGRAAALLRATEVDWRALARETGEAVYLTAEDRKGIERALRASGTTVGTILPAPAQDTGEG